MLSSFLHLKKNRRKDCNLSSLLSDFQLLLNQLVVYVDVVNIKSELFEESHTYFQEKLKNKFEIMTFSHCLYLDLNGKRPGMTSDGNFSSYLIGRS